MHAQNSNPAPEPLVAADLVLSSEHEVDCAWLAGVLAPLLPDIAVELLVSSRPLYWTRIVSPQLANADQVASYLLARGVAIRYLVSSACPSPLSCSPLDCTRTVPLRPWHWRARSGSPGEEVSAVPTWLGERGLAIDRRWCGSGAGTRLALIHDDAGLLEGLDLDAAVPVGVATLPRGSHQGARLIAAAVRTARYLEGEQFLGVAPDSAPRLYCIPVPGRDMVSLPVAIVRAIDDGADVIVCAHPWAEPVSALLDDALDYAGCCGRQGRGTPVLFPAPPDHTRKPGLVTMTAVVGRGPRPSMARAYLVGSLGPVGAPVVEARSGIRELRHGTVLGWLAAGDELEIPFATSDDERDGTGAVALAGGAMLLVLGRNPCLTLPELDQLLSRTRVESPTEGERPGHGRIHATRACLGACDPVALTLVGMGEVSAALRYLELRQTDPELHRAYSQKLGAWAARVLLGDAEIARKVRVLVRFARMNARRPEAVRKSGAWLARLARCVDLLRRAATERLASHDLREELIELGERSRLRLRDHDTLHGRTRWDRAFDGLVRQLWPVFDQPSPPPPGNAFLAD